MAPELRRMMRNLERENKKGIQAAYFRARGLVDER
jgi:hypothetical protein